MAAIGAVLFDWDGTLVGSRAALLAAWHAVTRDVLGSPWPLTPQDERIAFGRRGREVFPTLTDDPQTRRSRRHWPRGFSAPTTRAGSQLFPVSQICSTRSATPAWPVR